MTDSDFDFQLSRFEFSIRFLEDSYLREYKGPMLRGAIGHFLRNLYCQDKNFFTSCMDEKGDVCKYEDLCIYAILFKRLTKGGNITPFVISCYDKQTFFPAGANLNFFISLFSAASEYILPFIRAVKELEKRGFKNSKQFVLQSVKTYSLNTKARLCYCGDTDEYFNVINFITWKDIVQYCSKYKEHQDITIEFITPLKIKNKDGKYQEINDIEVLLRTIINRANQINKLYCNGMEFSMDMPTDSNILIREKYMKWQKLQITNERQESINLGGFTGKVKFSEDLEPYMPWLKLGELIHIGGKTVYGNGLYRIWNKETGSRN